MTWRNRVMCEPTIAAGFAHGLVAFAVANGATRATLYAQSGIQDAELDDHFNRIPLSRYIALMRSAKVLCDDPAIALHFGASSNCSDLTLVAMIASACESVEMAFELMNRYARISLDVDGIEGPDHFPIEHTREGAWLIDNRQHHGLCPELTETTFARFTTNIPRAFGRGAVRAVRLTAPAPAYQIECGAVFGVPVRYGYRRNAILLDPAVVSARIATAPRYALGVLTARADALLQALDDARSTRGRVEALLLPLLQTGDVSMDRIARDLAMSRPTLYRKLKAEGATYEELLDALRHRMALHHLSSPMTTVNEVSLRLGFSDPAAFSRAFKRWTGRSPRAATRMMVA